METDELITQQDNPSIKLIKNTKGYNWEIRVIGLDIAQLEAKNKEVIEMVKRFEQGETKTQEVEE